MAGRWSRRQLLRGFGASVLGGLAGCAAEPGRISVTPAPVPSDTPSPTATATPVPRPEVADLRFGVEVRSGFDEDGPARLSIAVRNDGPVTLTAVGPSPYVFPFVDDEYAGTDRSGNPRLFLLPEDAPVEIDRPGEEAKPVSTLVPEHPSDGCWSTTFEGWPPIVPSNRFLYAVPLPPGETVSHDYRVYFIGPCGTGRYAFQGETLVAAGDPPRRDWTYRLLTGFYLSVSPAVGISIGIEAPVLNSYSRSEDG